MLDIGWTEEALKQLEKLRELDGDVYIKVKRVFELMKADLHDSRLNIEPANSPDYREKGIYRSLVERRFFGDGVAECGIFWQYDSDEGVIKIITVKEF